MAEIVVIAPSTRGSAICHLPSPERPRPRDEPNAELLQDQAGRGVSLVSPMVGLSGVPQKALEAVRCTWERCSSGGWG